MKTKSLIVVVALCLAGSAPTSKATFLEGFQDGNRTANPERTVTNPLIGGSDRVIADPFRQDNLVLEMAGTDSAHRFLLTTAIDESALGFRFEAEYAVSTDDLSCATTPRKPHFVNSFPYLVTRCSDSTGA